MNRTDAEHLADLRIGVIGPGRLGTALSAALRAAGLRADAPLRRVSAAAHCDIVLLCVPDRAIGEVAAQLPHRDGRLVGHCSGATTLAPLAPHERFSMHPLMTITHAGAVFNGAAAAVSGSTDRAQHIADALARVLGMSPVPITENDRAAYHGAACVASNYLVTVLDLAERLAEITGMGRAQLAPIVRASVENWIRVGGQAALTGPVQRGDEDTVATHRGAVAHRLGDDVEFLDALVSATRRLAGEPPGGEPSR